MDNLWNIYGKNYDNLWIIYGISMGKLIFKSIDVPIHGQWDYLWIIYGNYGSLLDNSLNGIIYGKNVIIPMRKVNMNGAWIIYGIISFIYGRSMDDLWTIYEWISFKEIMFSDSANFSAFGSFSIHRPYGIEDLPSLGLISWSMVKYPAVPMWQSQWEIKPPVGDGENHDPTICKSAA